MTRILLTGCGGKMGRVVADVVSSRNDCEIAAGIDLKADDSFGFKVYKSFAECNEDIDVIIDFSHPSVTDELLDFISDRNIPAVVCTTGLSAEQVDRIRRTAKTTPIFYSANMSLGVNLLVELAKKATGILGMDFDIEIVEKHHNKKVDAPSGTALMLADAIAGVTPYSAEYVYDRHAVRKARSREEIGIHAVRGGTIVGEHEVIFAGKDEIITLSHSARSKDVFAVGAVNAAVFIKDKQPGLYDMGSMLSD